MDAAAGRHDRVVSDLVFLMLGRIDLRTGVDLMKTPYDKVVKTILQHVGINKIEATQDLMRDKVFRHLLGEPLATGIQQWWKAFQEKFTHYWAEPEELGDDELDMALHALATANAPLPQRAAGPRRRAAYFQHG